MKIEPGKFDLTPEVHKQLVRNLVKRTKEFTPESITAGKDWYPGGQEDSEYIGSEAGVGRLGGAAILGKLSSGTEWGKNRMMGLQLLRITDKQHSLIRRAGELPGDEGKVLRRRAGLSGTPLNLQTTANILDALKVRNNDVKPLEVFKENPNGSRKTSDFTKTLDTGGAHPFATIDTHAYDAALDSYHIKYGVGNEHLAKAGVYNFMQNVYAHAHAHALKQGLVPSDTTVADFQAMHWTHQINNKVKVNTRAASTAKAAITQTTNLLAENPTLDPSSHGLRPIVTRSAHFEAGLGEGK